MNDGTGQIEASSKKVDQEQIEARFKKVGQEQIEASSKKVRGRSKRTLALIEAMKKIAQETHPITGRGIGYKLFTAGLIDSMNDMNVVYRALKTAREEGTIPWDWIVDETRGIRTRQHMGGPF